MKHLSILGERFGPDRVLGGLTAVNAVLAPNGDVVQSPVKIDMTGFGEVNGQRSRALRRHLAGLHRGRPRRPR